MKEKDDSKTKAAAKKAVVVIPPKGTLSAFSAGRLPGKGDAMPPPKEEPPKG